MAELNSKNCPLNYLVSNDCLIYFIRSISLFALYLGAPVIADIIKALEGTVVIHVLEVVGGGLAAWDCDNGLCHWSKRFLGFLFLAYFMSIVFKSLEITMVTYAIFGVIIALIFVQVQKANL